jgi:hypothetical protein
MKRLKYYLALLAITVVFLAGCSSANSPSVPAIERGNTTSGNSHSPWGFYQFTYNPLAGTLEFVPLRSSAMHLNALPFLEPPVLANLTLDGLTIDPAPTTTTSPR